MMEPTKVLICEDDPDISRILETYLVGQGYEACVAENQAVAEEKLAGWSPHMILLDIRLAESPTAGWDLLAKTREQGSTPVIMITAFGRLDDRVRGLSEGADDFISKPFDLAEVGARIAAVLRRTRPGVPELGLVIDDDRKEVRVGDRRIPLSPKEYGLLNLLASDPGRVFSSDEILAELWGDRAYATVQDVQKFIYLLRKKIEADAKDPKIVLTARGFGYRLAL